MHQRSRDDLRIDNNGKYQHSPPPPRFRGCEGNSTLECHFWYRRWFCSPALVLRSRDREMSLMTEPMNISEYSDTTHGHRYGAGCGGIHNISSHNHQLVKSSSTFNRDRSHDDSSTLRIVRTVRVSSTAGRFSLHVWTEPRNQR